MDDQLKLAIPKNKELTENEFGNDWFDIELNVVSEKGIEKKLDDMKIKCVLLYENGDVANAIKVHTNPYPLILMKGVCKFKIKIDTLSMYNDNRSYKIVFSVSNNIGKHIEDYTTSSFKLVLSIHFLCEFYLYFRFNINWLHRFCTHIHTYCTCVFSYVMYIYVHYIVWDNINWLIFNIKYISLVYMVYMVLHIVNIE